MPGTRRMACGGLTRRVVFRLVETRPSSTGPKTGPTKKDPGPSSPAIPRWAGPVNPGNLSLPDRSRRTRSGGCAPGSSFPTIPRWVGSDEPGQLRPDPFRAIAAEAVVVTDVLGRLVRNLNRNHKWHQVIFGMTLFEACQLVARQDIMVLLMDHPQVLWSGCCGPLRHEQVPQWSGKWYSRGPGPRLGAAGRVGTIQRWMSIR